jgi:hypothetical protein
MNEEFRSFRILLVPLALIIIVPITRSFCSKPVEQPKQQTTQAAPSTGGGIKGLQIDQAPPSGLGSSRPSSDFPPGLDAARIQYLVEIDRQFSEPKTVVLLKKYDEKDPVQKAMIKLKYAQNSDGTMTLTRDGLMSLAGISEDDTSWKFPIAKRVFDEVSFIDRVEDERYKATFKWHWQPNAVGERLGIDAQKAYSATAEFAGGQGNWVLSNWIVPPVEPESSEK